MSKDISKTVYIMLLTCSYDDYPDLFKKFSIAVESHMPKGTKLLYKSNSRK